MSMFAAALALFVSPGVPAELRSVWDDAEIIVERMFEPYEDHPAGRDVFNYHVCLMMERRNDHALFIETQGILPLASQIWDFRAPQLANFRTNPSEEFQQIYGVIWNTRILESFGEIGREECQHLFDQYALSREDYNRLLDESIGPD